MSVQDVKQVAVVALQFAQAQSLPLEGLSVALGGIVPDVSLHCWAWPAGDLERWATQHAPGLEPWEGHNFVGRRGQVQVYGVAMLLAVIVRKA